MKLRAQTFLLFLLLWGACTARPVHGQQPTSPNREVLDAVDGKKDLYPADADAKKEIAEALKNAANEKKRVLLVFGANWCYDCHVLDRALHDGEAGTIVKESFLLVHVDIGEADKNLDLAKKYQIPLEKGVPAVVILGSDGSLLYSSGDGEFEPARRMMKRDLVAFLNRWKVKRIVFSTPDSIHKITGRPRESPPQKLKDQELVP